MLLQQIFVLSTEHSHWGVYSLDGCLTGFNPLEEVRTDTQQLLEGFGVVVENLLYLLHLLLQSSLYDLRTCMRNRIDRCQEDTGEPREGKGFWRLWKDEKPAAPVELLCSAAVPGSPAISCEIVRCSVPSSGFHPNAVEIQNNETNILVTHYSKQFAFLLHHRQ